MQLVGTVDPSRVLYSVKETAKLMAVSERAIYNLLEQGTLNSVKVGARRLVRRADLESFVNRLTEA
jgi:excisionase family DNA binding protein